LGRSIAFPKKVVVAGEMVVMVTLWRVVSKVGKDSVDYLEGFEGLMHLGLPVTNAGHRRKRLEKG
jgi:hypothetical protein